MPTPADTTKARRRTREARTTYEDSVSLHVEEPSLQIAQSRVMRGNRATEALIARLRANRAAAERLAHNENALVDENNLTTTTQTDDQEISSARKSDSILSYTTAPASATQTQSAEQSIDTETALSPDKDIVTEQVASQPTELETQNIDEAVVADVSTDASTESVETENTDAATAVTNDLQMQLEPGPQIRAWQSKVNADTQAIAAPDMAGASAAPSAVRSQGGALRESRTSRRQVINEEADAAISPAPESEEPRPDPPPQPVPAATEAVEDTAGKELTAATLPALQPSPRGTQPRVPLPRSANQPTPAQIDSQSESANSEQQSENVNSDSQVQVDAVESATEEPVPQPISGTAEGATIAQTPEPERPALPAPLTSVMREVVAKLLVNPRQQAEPILQSARKEAYPNEILVSVFQNVGANQLDGLTDTLSTALRAVATDAGVAADELEAAVTRQREAVEATAAQCTTDISDANTEQSEAISTESGEEVGEVEAAEEAQNAYTTAVLTEAQGEANPEVIERRANAQIRTLNRRAGALRFGYTRSKDRFDRDLDIAAQQQVRAYDRTLRDDAAAIDAEHQESNTAVVALLQGGLRVWGNERKRILAEKVRELKTAAANESTGFKTDTTTAVTDATEQIRAWQDEQTGEERSWWDRFTALFNDWSAQAEVEAAAWSEVRAGEARDSAVINLMTLEQFVAQQGQNVDVDRNEAFARLTSEQQAVIHAYYNSPSDNRDSIGAVAAGLRHRMATQQKTPLINALKAEVMAKPDSQWAQFEQIGVAERPGFNAQHISTQLHDAMFGGLTGLGTDEEKIYSNLSGLTPIQGRAVRGNYRVEYESNLDSDLASELDADNALIRAKAALDGDPVMEAVGALNEAMDGAGTDEDTIMSVLRGKSAEQRERIVEEYRRQYGRDLNAELDGEMDDHDQLRAEALLAGNTSRADAIAIDQAMHGGFLGLGTDEGQIEGVYEDIRGDVATEQIRDPGTGLMRQMTQAEMEQEVLRRNQHVEAEYNNEYGAEGDQQSALRAAYKGELSGPDLDLANALADNDLVAADAARLQREKLGFYTDDDVVNGVLENQYARALDAIERDPRTAARRTELSKRAQELNWGPYEIANAERQLQRRIEQEARAGATRNMAALEDRYDSKYSRWGSGGLQVMIAFNMSGTDQEKARSLVEQGGYLSPAQRIDYATRGAGTDEAEFVRATAGRTAAEIAEINEELQRMGRPSVQDIADEELSGREHFDMQVTLRGVPENAEEELRQAEMRVAYERENSFVGGIEERVMNKRLARMRSQFALINDPNASAFERRRAMAQFQSRGRGVQSAVESYRAQVDAVTDIVSTVVAIAAAVAAVAVAAAITVATGGTAGPVMLAIIGAIAATVAAMSTKAIMKGAAYGAEDMAFDAAVGVVDVIGAAATAGMGNVLLRVANSQSGRFARLGTSRLSGTLSRMATSSSRAQRMLAHGTSEMIEGAAGGVPAAFAGNVLNDQNWEHGNAFTNIMAGTVMETGMGAVMSGGMGAGGGFSAPKVSAPTTRTSTDILAHRGTPAERANAWRQYKTQNPDADMRSFLRQYDAAVQTRLDAQAKSSTHQRALRKELLAGIPPAQRSQFDSVKIEVMSDADFRAFTRSDSGNAVTVIRDGKPHVIMRDGAPPTALREEGIHLKQATDPILGRLVRRLDEARLGKWDSLSVGEKLELYTIKIHLELDAQTRLIKSLRDDLAQAANDDAAKAFRKQIDMAETNLQNLTKRAREVAALEPADRIAMARGLRDPPAYLDQPARLFSKSSKKKVDDVVNDVSDAANDSAHSAEPEQELEVEINEIVPETTVPRTVDVKHGSTIKTREVFEGALDDIDLEVRDGALHYKSTGEEVPHGTHFDKTDTTPSFTYEGPRDVVIEVRKRFFYYNSTNKKVPNGTRFYATETIPAFRYKGKRTVTVDRPIRTVEIKETLAGKLHRIYKQKQTRSVDSRGLKLGKWQKRGDAYNEKGAIGELASRLHGMRDPHILAQFYVQRPDGTGLDGVELILGDNGSPILRLVEVKHYDGHVSGIEKFTAVIFRTSQTKGNLEDNFTLLQETIGPTPDDIELAVNNVTSRFGDKVDPNSFQADPDVIAAAVEIEKQKAAANRLGIDLNTYLLTKQALKEVRLELVIRRSENTKIGNKLSTHTLPTLLRRWLDLKRHMKIFAIGGITPDIRPKIIVETLDNDLLDQAQAAIRGINKMHSSTIPPQTTLFPTSKPGRFTTEEGQAFVDVMLVKGSEESVKTEELVNQVIDSLFKQADKPAGTPNTAFHVVVDLTNFTGDKEAFEKLLMQTLEELGITSVSEISKRLSIIT